MPTTRPRPGGGCDAMPAWLQAVARVVAALLADWRARRARDRAAAVRAAPADAWLRRFGGTDKRASSRAADARSRGDGDLDV